MMQFLRANQCGRQEDHQEGARASTGTVLRSPGTNGANVSRKAISRIWEWDNQEAKKETRV